MGTGTGQSALTHEGVFFVHFFVLLPYLGFRPQEKSPYFLALCVLCETVVFFVVSLFHHKGHKGYTKITKG